MGDIIAGKYEVEALLGQGGMGVVVSARHLTLGQRVAVKFLLPSAATLPGAVDRFLREARSAVAIQSEHVARVLDVGTMDSGAPYMVMEHLVGTDLRRVLSTRGTLTVPEAVDYILQAGEALAEAHALGIIHRDLKPANIFVTSRLDGSPFVKVLDFGLSTPRSTELYEAQAVTLTSTEAVMGSPPYMSPEQIRSLKNVDLRTDIWSLGVILYRLLAGKRPFLGETLPAVVASIAADTPAPLTAARPEIPPALDAIVQRCLAKDVAQRVQTIAELAQALAPFGSAEAQVSLSRILKATPGAGPPSLARASFTSQPPSSMSRLEVHDPSTAHASAWSQPRAPGKRSSKMPVLVAGGALLALAAVALVSTRRPPTPAAAPLADERAVAAPGVTAARSALADAPPAPAETAAPGAPLAQPGKPSASPAARPLPSAPIASSTPKRSVRPKADPRPLSRPPPEDPLERWK